MIKLIAPILLSWTALTLMSCGKTPMDAGSVDANKDQMKISKPFFPKGAQLFKDRSGQFHIVPLLNRNVDLAIRMQSGENFSTLKSLAEYLNRLPAEEFIYIATPRGGFSENSDYVELKDEEIDFLKSYYPFRDVFSSSE